MSRAPAGPFGAAVGTGSVNPAEQAAIGFGLARVVAGLSRGAGTSSWFSRPTWTARIGQHPAAVVPAVSGRHGRPGPGFSGLVQAGQPDDVVARDARTWGPESSLAWTGGLPGPAAGPDRRELVPHRCGIRPGSLPRRLRSRRAPRVASAGSAVQDFGLLPRPGSAGEVLSGAPACWSSAHDTAVGLRPVPLRGCPAQRGGPQRGPRPSAAPSPRAVPRRGLAERAGREGKGEGTSGTQGGTSGTQGGTSGTQGGTSGTQGGTSGTCPAARDDRAPAAQKTTGPLHSAAAPPAPAAAQGERHGHALIVLALALIAALIWLALAS